MYMSPLERYGFMRPEASGGGGIVNIYVHMAKQLSISLIAPLVSQAKTNLFPFLTPLQILGQLVQIIWPKQAKIVSTKLRFNIIGGLIFHIAHYSKFS
jgi:hypothetical protein